MDTKFDLTAFRQEFLINGEGWGVSDCYKPYDDKFLRRDAQDAYDGAKWAWQHQQAKVVDLQKQLIDQGQRFNEQAQVVKDLEFKNGELQNRVDRALESIRETCDTNCNLATDDYYYLVEDLLGILDGKIVVELEQALKGESND